MSQGNSDVDALWQRLRQQQSRSDGNARLEPLWQHISKGSLRRDTCLSSVKQKPYIGELGPCKSKGDAVVKHPKLCLQDSATAYKLIQALKDPDKVSARQALLQLQAALDDDAASGVIPTVKLGKACLRCFEHRAEACRCLSVECFTKLLQADPDSTLSLLPYALPVLQERFTRDQAQSPIEPSEEVRLCLAQLLSLILDQAASAIAAYASEVWSILTEVLADGFHEVAMQGCKVSQQLAGILGQRLQATSKELVAALLPLTTHNRHRVRIAAIHAIRDVLHQGAHEMILQMVAWRDPNLVPIKAFYGDDVTVNFCGKLATDHHVQVRLAFLDMVGNWMLTLRERRDHEARLLPYILSAVCDDSPVVVNAALHLLDQLGQQYEAEHEQELADLMRFEAELARGPEAKMRQLLQRGEAVYAGCWSPQALPHADLQPSRQDVACLEAPDLLVASSADAAAVTLQQPVTSTEPGSTLQTFAAGGSCTAQQQAQPLVLPGPFKERARLGSRLLVRSNFSALLPPLCRELSSWQSGPRVMSARLLLVALVLVESAAEQYLQVIVPALCSSMHDPEAGHTARACATVVGCFCSLSVLLDLLTPRLVDWVSEPQRQAAGLMLLSAVLRGAAPMQQLGSSASRLLQLLEELDMAASNDRSVQGALLQVVQQLLAPCAVHQLMAEDDRPPGVSHATAAVEPGRAQSPFEGSTGPSSSSAGRSESIANEGGTSAAAPAVRVLEQLVMQLQQSHDPDVQLAAADAACCLQHAVISVSAP